MIIMAMALCKWRIYGKWYKGCHVLTNFSIYGHKLLTRLGGLHTLGLINYSKQRRPCPAESQELARPCGRSQAQ